MAPLNPNTTGRVWLRYMTGGGTTSQNHELMFRYSDGFGATPLGAINVLAGWITALGAEAFFDGWKALSARFAGAGSDISLPLALPGSLVSFVGAGQTTASRQSQAREASFEGRSSSTGRRVSWSLYGLQDGFFSGADFRAEPAEGNWVQDTLDYIDEMDTGFFVTVDGSRATVYPYANWQYNSYWEGELRA